jgi:hypothetical protein
MGGKKTKSQKALHCHVCSKSCPVIGDDPDVVLCHRCDKCKLNFCLSCCTEFLSDLKLSSAACFKCNDRCCCQLLSHDDELCPQCCDTSAKRITRKKYECTIEQQEIDCSRAIDRLADAKVRSSKLLEELTLLELEISSNESKREALKDNVHVTSSMVDATSIEVSNLMKALQMKRTERALLEEEWCLAQKDNEELRRLVDHANNTNATINHEFQSSLAPRRIVFDDVVETSRNVYVQTDLTASNPFTRLPKHVIE